MWSEECKTPQSLDQQGSYKNEFVKKEFNTILMDGVCSVVTYIVIYNF